MADTGLLGFNPYGRGVALDFSSKPLAYAIQLEKEERAKDDALENYFRDVDKNVTSAGMRNVDVEDFNKQQLENKRFWIENKDSIKRPERDGGKAYTEYMRRINELFSFANQSKQEYDKAKTIFNLQQDAKRRGEIVDNETLNAIMRSQKRIKDPEFVSFNEANFKASKPFNPLEYAEKTYKGIPLSETAPQIKPLEGRRGFLYSVSSKKMDDSGLNKVVNNAYASFDNNDNKFRDYVAKISQDPDQVKAAAKKYKEKFGVDMPNNLREFAVGFTLTLSPETTVTGNPFEDPAYRRAQEEAARARRDAAKGARGESSVGGNLFDTISLSGTKLSDPKTGEKLVLKDGKVFYSGGKRDGQFYSASSIKGVPVTELPQGLLTLVNKKGGIDWRPSDLVDLSFDGKGNLKSFRIKDDKGKPVSGDVDRDIIYSYQEQSERKGEDIYNVDEEEVSSRVPSRGASRKQQSKFKGVPEKGF